MSTLRFVFFTLCPQFEQAHTISGLWRTFHSPALISCPLASKSDLVTPCGCNFAFPASAWPLAFGAGVFPGAAAPSGDLSSSCPEDRRSCGGDPRCWDLDLLLRLPLSESDLSHIPQDRNEDRNRSPPYHCHLLAEVLAEQVSRDALHSRAGGNRPRISLRPCDALSQALVQ